MIKLALPHLESLEQQVRTALAANDLDGLRTLLAAHHPADVADVIDRPIPPRDYLPQVTTRPIAAANIIAVVSHPMMLMPRLLTRLPITFVLLAMSSIRTNNGGAKKPLITAVQKSASIGLIPRKLISMPIRVETAITV